MLSEQLAQQLIVLGVTAACGLYWWFAVVPSERRRLSQRKRKPEGDIKQYLDDLEKAEANDRKVEKWFYSEWLHKKNGSKDGRKDQ